MNMKITEVRIRSAKEDFVKAYASICFDDCFLVHDIRVIKGSANLFISSSNRTQSEGGQRDIAFPGNAKTRQMIQVLASMRKYLPTRSISDDQGPTPWPKHPSNHPEVQSRDRGIDTVGGKGDRATGTVKSSYAAIAIGVDRASNSEAHVIDVRNIGRIKDSASCIFAQVNTGISEHEHAIAPIAIDSIRRYIAVGDPVDKNPMPCVAADGISHNASTRRTRNQDSILLVILN
jgi:stage V sporulation protein G